MDLELTRVCKTCNLPVDKNNFDKSSRRKDNLSLHCKPCNKLKKGWIKAKDPKKFNLIDSTRTKKWRSENREHYEKRMRNYTYLSRYNLSLDKYNEILLTQNNCCAICKEPETSISHRNNKVKFLSVDHCHETMTVRGLLCCKCNQALGSFKDSIEILTNAIQYMKNSKNITTE